MATIREKDKTFIYLFNDKNYSYSYFAPYITGFGLQEKNPKHTHGYTIKQEHTLQYISEGEGYYYVNKKRYTLKAGDMFYLPKNVMIKYSAKEDNPYKYYWVAFDGSGVEKFLKSLGFSVDEPIKFYLDNKITEILEGIGKYLLDFSNVNYMYANGELFRFFAYLLSKNKSEQNVEKSISQDYVNFAISKIKTKYNEGDFNVTLLAKTLGLTREHFSTVFKEVTGSSPIDYLIDYRINQAKKLLERGLSVTQTAFDTGFNSSSNFSVQFRKKVGVSPMVYKKRSKINENKIS